MDEYRESYHEVKLENYSHFGPHLVFKSCSTKGIVSGHSKMDALW